MFQKRVVLEVFDFTSRIGQDRLCGKDSARKKSILVSERADTPRYQPQDIASELKVLSEPSGT